MSKGLERFYENWIIGLPGWVVATILLMAIALAAGLPNFKLDASSDAFTLEHDKDLDFSREIASRYESGDFLVVTYKPNGDLFADESLNNLKAMRDTTHLYCTNTRNKE